MKWKTWYEIACSISIFALILVWGNSEYLYSILPVVGGAVGGAMGFMNLLAMKSCKSVPAKLAVWVAMLLATLFLCFAVALVIFSVLM